jgi:hypothetical protein
MKYTRILLLALLVLMVNSCSKEDYRTAIHGRVLNINSTDPIPNVKVYLAARTNGIYKIVDSTVAGKNGFYSLEHESAHAQRYNAHAFSPEHRPGHSVKNPISWPNDFPPLYRGKMNIYLVPKSWLRIQAVKTSDDRTCLRVVSDWPYIHAMKICDDHTWLWPCQGNQNMILGCGIVHLDSNSIIRPHKDTVMYYAPASDTVDVLVEW